MKIALTGATGFVGGHVLPLLLAEGHEVCALVRGQGRVASHPRLTVVDGSLHDEAALQMLTHRADAVLHLAGTLAGHTAEAFRHGNVEGTGLLAKVSAANGVSHFVHMSSLAARQPQLSHYAGSKLAAEKAIADAGFRGATTVLRAAAVYGEGDRATLPLLKTMMAGVAVIPGSAEQRFSLIHVADLAKCCLAALVERPSGVIEVDDGAGGYGWNDMLEVTRRSFGRPQRVLFLPPAAAMLLGKGADLAAALSGRSGMVSAGKMRELYFNDWRVQKSRWPGFPRKSLGEALPATITWYQQQGLLPRTAKADTSGESQGHRKT